MHKWYKIQKKIHSEHSACSFRNRYSLMLYLNQFGHSFQNIVYFDSVFIIEFSYLFQWHVSRSRSSTDTSSSVSDRLVGHRELAQVVSNHFRADFDLVENLSVVDSDLGANHLRDDDHVTEMCLDYSCFLVRKHLDLCLSDFLDEAHWLSLQPAGESTLI